MWSTVKKPILIVLPPTLPLQENFSTSSGPISWHTVDHKTVALALLSSNVLSLLFVTLAWKMFFSDFQTNLNVFIRRIKKSHSTHTYTCFLYNSTYILHRHKLNASNSFVAEKVFQFHFMDRIADVE